MSVHTLGTPKPGNYDPTLIDRLNKHAEEEARQHIADKHEVAPIETKAAAAWPPKKPLYIATCDQNSCSVYCLEAEHMKLRCTGPGRIVALGASGEQIYAAASSPGSIITLCPSRSVLVSQTDKDVTAMCAPPLYHAEYNRLYKDMNLLQFSRRMIAALCMHRNVLHAASGANVLELSDHLFWNERETAGEAITALCSHKGILYRASRFRISTAGSPLDAYGGMRGAEVSALASDGENLYDAGLDGSIRDTMTGMELLKVPNRITAMCFEP